MTVLCMVLGVIGIYALWSVPLLSLAIYAVMQFFLITANWPVTALGGVAGTVVGAALLFGLTFVGMWATIVVGILFLLAPLFVD